MLVVGAVAVAAASYGVFGSVTRAQTEPVVVEVVSVDATGAAAVAAVNTAPALSDDGGVVAFEAGDATDGSDRRVWIRDRVGETTDPVAEIRSRAPGISGNGCVVTYAIVDADTTALAVVDRCVADPGLPLPLGTIVDAVPTVLGPIEPDPGAPVSVDVAPAVDVPGEPVVAAAALSSDGSTIVWSTGDEIRRYVRSETTGVHERTHTFDAAPGSSPDSVSAVDLDVSADGATVVYLAGPGLAPFEPAPANVHVWNLAEEAVEPTIEVVSVTADGLPGASDSGSPSVSADGSLVVFESTGTDLAAAGTAPVTTPFVAAFNRLDRTTGILVENATRPAVSADGRHVVYQRGEAIRVMSWPGGGATSVDRGIDELATAAPLTGASLSQYGRWVVFASAALPSAAPAFRTGTQVWAVDLEAVDDSVLDTTTTTTIPPTTPTTPTTPPTIPATPPVPTTPIPVAPPTTSPGITLPGSTAFPTTVFPFPAQPPRRTTSSSSTSRFPNFLQPTTVDLAPVATPVATPVAFPPTVVDAGRRTESVVLTNQAAMNVTVSTTSIEPAGPFSIVDDGCSGLLGVGATCIVTVQFAPTEVGNASASLIFRLDDGSFVAATLNGDGTPEPTLDLVPEVAGAGQTVTVFGAGFPAGSTVEFAREGLPGSEPVIVDATGTFAHVLVVLPNTSTGPMPMTALGQADVFNDVSAELLVSTRGAASDGVALRGRLATR